MSERDIREWCKLADQAFSRLAEVTKATTERINDLDNRLSAIEKPAPKPETDRDARKLAEAIDEVFADCNMDNGLNPVDQIIPLIKAHDAALLARRDKND